MGADKLHEHDLPAEVECGDQPIVSTSDIEADTITPGTAANQTD
jgi:hypothetical protein